MNFHCPCSYERYLSAAEKTILREWPFLFAHLGDDATRYNSLSSTIQELYDRPSRFSSALREFQELPIFVLRILAAHLDGFICKPRRHVCARRTDGQALAILLGIYWQWT